MFLRSLVFLRFACCWLPPRAGRTQHYEVNAHACSIEIRPGRSRNLRRRWMEDGGQRAETRGKKFTSTKMITRYSTTLSTEVARKSPPHSRTMRCQLDIDLIARLITSRLRLRRSRIRQICQISRGPRFWSQITISPRRSCDIDFVINSISN